MNPVNPVRVIPPIVAVLLFIALLAPSSALAKTPSISSLSAASGAVGATVTISGSNFGSTQGSSFLSFNGVNATNITGWTASSITAIVPSGATTGNVVVTVAGSASNGVSFTVVPGPAISTLTPASGTLGSTVTTSGSNFGTSPGSITFSGTTATITSWSATSITATVPNGATSGNVIVFASGVNSNSLPFTVLPSISSISPGYGVPGSSQTITGASFGTSQGGVTFNGVAATVTSWNGTSIVATVPNGATSGSVVVQTSGTSSNGVPFWIGSLSQPVYHLHQSQQFDTSAPSAPSYVYTTADLNGNASGQATVTEFAPPFSILGKVLNSTTITFSIWMNESASVSGLYPLFQFGTWDTILGGTQQSRGTTTVQCQVEGSSALSTTWTKYTLTCSSPGFTDLDPNTVPIVNVSVGWSAGHAISKSVEAQVAVDGTANGNYDSTITIPELLSPSIGSVSPTPSTTGSTVTITGNAFGSTQGSGTVTFNGVPANVSSWSDSTISTTIPVDATSGPVIVTTPTQPSNGFLFTVSPQISSIFPGAGAAGTAVTVSGSGFGASQGATFNSTVTNSVAFNGLPALVTNWTSTSVTALVPANAISGSVVVAVNGASSNAVSFGVGPSLNQIAPNSGRPGTVVTIAGVNFGASQGSSTVTFNGTIASPTNWSNNQIVVPVPPGATAGSVTVSVGGIPSNGLPFTIGNGSISGNVSQNGSGSPVAAADLQVFQAKSVVGTAVTAQDGSYSVGNLASGTYDVVVSANGYGSAVALGNAVTAGSNTTVNISLSPPGTLSGQVTAANGGTAISGATLNVLQAGDLVVSGTTDSSGNYSIATIGPGSYTAQVFAPGFQSNTQNSLTISSGTTTTADFTLGGQKAITYTYDAVGHLIGAVDPQGNAVVYSYDSVGNIQAINEYPSSQVSIIGISPSSGPVGTTITISGSGFSSTVSNDSVSFNGTPAAVVSATGTQIVATVPAGATTGTISVTAPLGTATSTTPFTVTQ